MTSIRKFLLVAGMALAAVAMRPNAGAAAVLTTSPLWADSSGGTYHACNLVNVTSKPLSSVKVELLDSAGVVLITQTLSNLAPGTAEEVTAGGVYSGFAWCRFTLSGAKSIRANITVFVWTGSYYDSIAFDSAR